MTLHLPVGLNPTAIGVDGSWWLDVARRAEDAGFDTVWAWDHFMSRGDVADPLLECWTMLTAAAVSTQHIRVGSFVVNAMNRHPAVLANIVATLADLAPGRVELGIGIGGNAAEHEAYGMDFPPAPERASRLEETLAILQLLFDGGPVDYDGRHYQLRAAYASPPPRPRPRITVAGMTPAGARIAARLGDAWTCHAPKFESLRDVFEGELERVGRDRRDVPIIVGVEPEDTRDLEALTARWRELGASELIIHDVRPAEMDRILALA